MVRAGINGTVGTTMAVPAFEEEKWHPLNSNVRVHILPPVFVIASDAKV